MDRSFTTKEQKVFYQTGIVLLVLALLDVGNLAVNIIYGVFDVNTYAGFAPVGLIRVIVGIFLTISVLAIMVQALLGAKAMSEAKSPSTARAHIVIAKIAGVVSAIIAVLSIIGLIGSEFSASEVMSVITAVVDAVIMFIYASEAEKVRVK